MTLAEKQLKPRIISQWENIPETEPDEIDLEMLNEIDNDINCQIFITEAELLANRRKVAEKVVIP
ncbi:MAG: hypothetical protein FWG64_00105 [Firmicutes bacterium]|nr:hypothetical protein [Bacillota bacterium]